MKIALTNLCKTEDFTKHKSYKEALSFLDHNNIEYVDYASGADTIEKMVEKFNQSLDSDVDLVWVVRGGNKCIETLDNINWEKVSSSGKKFFGLSDFTHFSTMAVSKGATCYYGQGLTNIKEYFPTESDRKFISDLLVSGVPVSENATALFNAEDDLDLSKEKIVGGHLFIFSFMQSQLKIDLKERFVFIEYHIGSVGETISDLGYYMDQLLYDIKDNIPKGFILGHTEMTNLDGTKIPIEQINDFCVNKLSKFNLPIYYLDHFKNTVTFS